MFKLLEQQQLSAFQKDSTLLNKLIQRNAMLKAKVVQEDEFEQGERKLLNYGHTLGHAIENDYELPHGFAIAIGMVVAGPHQRAVYRLCGNGKAGQCHQTVWLANVSFFRFRKKPCNI